MEMCEENVKSLPTVWSCPDEFFHSGETTISYPLTSMSQFLKTREAVTRCKVEEQTRQREYVEHMKTLPSKHQPRICTVETVMVLDIVKTSERAAFEEGSWWDYVEDSWEEAKTKVYSKWDSTYSTEQWQEQYWTDDASYWTPYHHWHTWDEKENTSPRYSLNEKPKD